MVSVVVWMVRQRLTNYRQLQWLITVMHLKNAGLWFNQSRHFFILYGQLSTGRSSWYA